MSRTILSRLGAGVIATALVAGGSFLAAAPAMAAGGDETLVLANNVYSAGSWGDGVSFTGENYTPGATVEVGIAVTSGNSGDTYGFIDVVADPTTGAISGVLTPADLAPSTTLQPGQSAFVYSSYEVEGENFGAVVPINILPFVAAPASVTIIPSCIGADAASSVGVTATGTGFGQNEADVLVTITDANGVNFGTNENFDADATGSITITSRLFTNLGLIPDGNYTITFSSRVNPAITPSGTFKVGACDVATPPAPAAVAPAAPQLANTGSSDAGVLVGGSALLLLVGAALVVARRRQNAAA